MHEVLVNRLGGLSLPRKSVVGLTDRPDMALDVYRGRKTTMQQQQQYTNYVCQNDEQVEVICILRFHKRNSSKSTLFLIPLADGLFVNRISH